MEEVVDVVDGAGKRGAEVGEGEVEGAVKLRKVPEERINRVELRRRPRKANKVKDVERVGKVMVVEAAGMARVRLARCNALE